MLKVVALLLSVSGHALCVPMGYKYPTPAIPFIEGATVSTTPAPKSEEVPDCVPEDMTVSPYYQSLLELGVPLCPVEYYDEYDPNDIPPDQAASEVVSGYNYPVPDNPLTLPTKPKTTPSTTTSTTASPLPDCIPLEDQYAGKNPEYLDLGVPFCTDEYDDYDPNDIPSDQAAPAPSEPGYNYPVPENPLTLPTRKPTTTTTSTPLILPNCVQQDEVDIGENPIYLLQGVPLCPQQTEPLPSIPTYTTPKKTTQITTAAPSTTTRKPLPNCIIYEEQDIGNNPEYIDLGVPFCPEEYDDYDPSDIPSDQAAEEGYNYPTPENPLTLPTKPTTVAITTTTPTPITTTSTTTISPPDCISETDINEGDNPYFLDIGVPICPSDNEILPGYQTEEYYDEYDPSDIPEDQAAPQPDCVLNEEKDKPENKAFIQAGVPLCEKEKEGYNYPVPKNPLTLPPRKKKTTTTTSAPLPDCVPFDVSDKSPYSDYIAQGVPLCPDEYDEYDPNDIPADQAAPAEKGYSYPVPTNPLRLPKKLRKSKVFSGEDIRSKDESLTIGLTHDKFDSYDPGNYDHNNKDYIDEVILDGKPQQRRPKKLRGSKEQKKSLHGKKKKDRKHKDELRHNAFKKPKGKLGNNKFGGKAISGVKSGSTKSTGKNISKAKSVIPLLKDLSPPIESIQHLKLPFKNTRKPDTKVKSGSLSKSKSKDNNMNSKIIVSDGNSHSEPRKKHRTNEIKTKTSNKEKQGKKSNINDTVQTARKGKSVKRFNRGHRKISVQDWLARG